LVVTIFEANHANITRIDRPRKSITLIYDSQIRLEFFNNSPFFDVGVKLNPFRK